MRLVSLGGALVWIAVVAAGPRLLERVELAALDTELRLAPPSKASPEIVIVAVDERSVHRYGPLRWPPEQMAAVVHALDRAAPRVIAFDFVFSAEGERRRRPHRVAAGKRADVPGPSSARRDAGATALPAATEWEPLRAAVAQSGRVVLGTYFDFDADLEDAPPAPPADFRTQRVQRVRYLGGASPRLARGSDSPPVLVASSVHSVAPELAAAARAYGHLNLLPSDDGIIRWMPLVARYQDDFYPAFAVHVVRAYLAGAAATAEDAQDVQPELLVARQRVQGLQIAGRRISTDEHGGLLVRFAGSRGSYATFSAADLLAGAVPADRLRDRIVLIGSTAAGAADVWATPLDPLLPGVEIHANAIANLLRGDFLVRNWLTRLLTFAALAGLGLAGALALPWASRFGLRRAGAAAAAGVALGIAGHYWLFTRSGYAVDLVAPLLCAATILSGTLVVSYFTEEKRRQQVEHSFAHYLDRSVIAELLEQPERLRLGGQRRELTVLFCDIRNFTTLAEGQPPEATVEMLNEFFTTMTNVVFSSGGLVDKFVGDQIMAVWGAPVERRDHAAGACAAALGMMHEFARLHSQWVAANGQPPSGAPPQPKMHCGVGINSGPMVVGNIGSARRFSYTVIGDNVNVASRLESLNKLYGTEILVGPSTYAAARERYRFREIDQVRVRGRSQALAVYELLGTSDAPLDADWLAAFAEGLCAYRRGDWAAAARAFAAAVARRPGDACAAYYQARVAQYAKSPPAADWEGALYLR